MKTDIRFACPLDCPDACALIAEAVDGRVVRIRGDKDHPVTRGNVCVKGKQHLKRLYHPDRLKRPRRRIGSKWTDITWAEAIDEIAGTLSSIKESYGPLAVLNYSASGYGGLKKTADRMFFTCFGGATTHRGSLCWGAGIAAQTYDFGAVRGHAPEDMARAGTIILWGRNPADTNTHLVPFLKTARSRGARLWLIDPVKTASARLCDAHISIVPGADGALALAMAHVIIRKGLADQDYIDRHVTGFAAFSDHVAGCTPEWAEGVTGVDRRVIIRLAEACATEKPACIILGLGMQRYQNGGNTIRCIDALGAITGNIGVSGGGVNYANFSASAYISSVLPEAVAAAAETRTFPIGKLADFLNAADDPPVKCMFISKANPLVQVPDINKTVRAFSRIDFKAVIDMFMTDTARHADMVLPCTSILEEEDVILTNMFSPYVNYSCKAVAPPDGVMSEYDFFAALAEKTGLSGYPFMSGGDFLKEAIRPLTERFGVDIEGLKRQSFCIPESDIPWKDGRFETPSGRFELYSERAAQDGLSPLPAFSPPSAGEDGYDLRLITPHARDSMHSQNFVFTDDPPLIYVNRNALNRCGLADGGAACVFSPRGKLTARVRRDDAVRDGVAMMHQGWGHKSGAVNLLTADRLSDMGEQAAYYECFCRVAPAE